MIDSGCNSSFFLVNHCLHGLVVEPIFAQMQMVGIVLLASSILIPIAGRLAKTDAQLINDQMINADL